MNRAVILIVDDEPSNIDVISHIFQDKYDIRVAHSGEKALKAIEKLPIDLILLDIQMPNMDGFEVAQSIRQKNQHQHIPIIFVTSQIDETSIVKGFELGGNDYITKPFNVAELKARIHTHLQVSQLQKSLKLMLNMQPNMIILTDGIEGEFINQTGLDFFDLATTESFIQRYHCIKNTFVPIEGCFYPRRRSKSNWIEQLLTLAVDKHHVAIRSNKSKSIHIFKISIASLPNSNKYIVGFSDITSTMHTQEQLKDQLIHDTLTGAYNREYFKQNIQRITQRNRYKDEDKAVAFLDLDHFKKINDTYGHDVGDTVLISFVNVITEHIRTSDTFIRWGGEEFILIMNVPNEKILEMLLETLRLAIANYPFETINHITCSIGATFLLPNESIEETIKRADDALYKAKESGRNRICIE